jgi:tRNA (cmo5U34)-methyltransferase
MTDSSLGHLPAKEKWEFDEGVTECFDDMLRRSIPQYAVMRGLAIDIAERFAESPGDVLDLGSSRGDSIAPLIEKFGSAKRFRACESSEPMLAYLRKRFERPIAEGYVMLDASDLRHRDRRTWLVDSVSVASSILTLQFVPINYRQGIVRDVFQSLLPGGGFIFVEKVLGESSEIDDLLVALYHGLKGENGYGKEEIARKAMALEGILVPVTASWNVDLLRQAGFRQVDCFWRCLNFAGWIAVKE